MAATIKAIAPNSVHLIQSGQVIVDLCSVVKELVENSLDAQATAIEVRFRDHGLELIEIQDNGTGISEANYESLALKHYTSKLSTYDDLDDLHTFGFRGEALSSLCALSTLSVTTCEAHETPRGKRLDFEMSGKLKSTTLVAAQKGTIVSVENLFSKLPVRQKELSKNIKREYSKVLKLLQAYACIATKVKFVVKNAPSKGKSTVTFSTKGNASTRDNIANVFGAKLLSQLIDLDLKLDYEQSSARRTKNGSNGIEIAVHGHISRPVFGEGKQSTDQQMFFVNGRPCNLPQIAKAINEVYRSYNMTQSPFIFANLKLDTSSYDVNVSPDKRSILLHDAAALTERLKEELGALFDKTDQTVPQSQVGEKKLPAFKPLMISRPSADDEAGTMVQNASGVEEDEDGEQTAPDLLRAHFQQIASTREDDSAPKNGPDPEKLQKARERQAGKMAERIKEAERQQREYDEYHDAETVEDISSEPAEKEIDPVHIHVRDFNARLAEAQEQSKAARDGSSPIQSNSEEQNTSFNLNEEKGVVNQAYGRIRQRKTTPEIATITIGDRTVTRTLGDVSTRTQQTNGGTSQMSQHLAKFDMNIHSGDQAEEDRRHPTAGNRDEIIITSEKESKHVAVHDDNTEDDATEREGSPAMAAQEQDESPANSERSPQSDSWPDTDQATTSMNAEWTRSGQTSTQKANIANSKVTGHEEAARNQEEYRVAELIQMAELSAKCDKKERQRRTNQALKGSGQESTVSIVAILDTSTQELSQLYGVGKEISQIDRESSKPAAMKQKPAVKDEIERLSLTISKSDFSKMHIAGQFNLGFIIALRHKDTTDAARQRDELFIIDQHASDEKYNFERLQAETVVGNQRLVRPIKLELTAVEEEIVFDHNDALRQNGFVVEADQSGDLPVGERCLLTSLPLSKELIFNTHDFEELIHLLSESHLSSSASQVPRPSKVRKMFAMRACRSSIMIGKTLSMTRMRQIVNHMGTIDQPWNCPHGRPTMRHLTSLDQLDKHRWREGDGLVSDGDSELELDISGPDVWQRFMA